MRRIAALALPVVAVVACGLFSPAPVAAQNVRILSIDSSAIAAAPLIALSDPLMLTRGPSADPESRIGSVVLDETGKVYMLDTGLREVVTVSGDGTALVIMGRKGLGSGEFYQPMVLAAARDSIVVLDVAPRNSMPGARLHVFDASGSVHSTVDLPQTWPYRFISALQGSDYGWMAHVVERPEAFFNEARKGPFPVPESVAYVSLSDFTLRTRIAFESSPLFSISSTMAMVPPMTPSPAVAMAGDGRLYTRLTDRYEIDVQAHDVSAETRIVADVEPQAFTRQNFAAWLAEEIRKARARDTDTSREWAEGLEKHGEWVGYAKTRPVIGELAASRGGLVLAERLDLARAATEDDAGFRRWDLIDIRKGIVGRLETPSDVSIAAFEWPWLCLRYTGAHGNSIVRYTLRRR